MNFMFTVTHKFFDNMGKEEIMRWADTCMDFVYNDLGYKKEQILQATIYMGELNTSYSLRSCTIS